MFRKFSPSEDLKNLSLVKSSTVRGLRGKLQEQFPALEDPEALELVLPKKEKLSHAKTCGGGGSVQEQKVSVYVNGEGRIVFFHGRDGPIYPELHVVHEFPWMMPSLRVDKGAIKFVFSGANIMCPGLTSSGATLHDDVEAGSPVAVYAEGKEHALAVGLAAMSTSDIRQKGQGVAVEMIHHLSDGLWSSFRLPK